MDKTIWKAKRLDNGEWVSGFYKTWVMKSGTEHTIFASRESALPIDIEIDPTTLVNPYIEKLEKLLIDSVNFIQQYAYRGNEAQRLMDELDETLKESDNG